MCHNIDQLQHFELFLPACALTGLITPALLKHTGPRAFSFVTFTFPRLLDFQRPLSSKCRSISFSALFFSSATKKVFPFDDARINMTVFHQNGEYFQNAMSCFHIKPAKRQVGKARFIQILL